MVHTLENLENPSVIKSKVVVNSFLFNFKKVKAKPKANGTKISNSITEYESDNEGVLKNILSRALKSLLSLVYFYYINIVNITCIYFLFLLFVHNGYLKYLKIHLQY